MRRRLRGQARGGRALHLPREAPLQLPFSLREEASRGQKQPGSPGGWLRTRTRTCSPAWTSAPPRARVPFSSDRLRGPRARPAPCVLTRGPGRGHCLLQPRPVTFHTEENSPPASGGWKDALGHPSRIVGPRPSPAFQPDPSSGMRCCPGQGRLRPQRSVTNTGLSSVLPGHQPFQGPCFPGPLILSARFFSWKVL